MLNLPVFVAFIAASWPSRSAILWADVACFSLVSSLNSEKVEFSLLNSSLSMLFSAADWSLRITNNRQHDSIRNKKSAHLTTAERCTPTNWSMANIHIWLVWPCNRRQTDSWTVQCISTWTNLSLPARLSVSQGGGRCVKPIDVLHPAVDSCTLHVDYTYSYNNRRLALAVWK